MESIEQLSIQNELVALEALLYYEICMSAINISTLKINWIYHVSLEIEKRIDQIAQAMTY